MRSIASLVASTRSPPTYEPAFACRMSICPARPSTLGTSVAQAFASSRSITSGIAFLPRRSQSVARAAPSLSTSTTRAPAASMASVLARPTPDAAPVTTPTLPSRSFAIMDSFGAIFSSGAAKPRGVSARRCPGADQARPCDWRERRASESTITAMARTPPVIMYRSDDDRSSSVRPLEIDWMTMIPSKAE